MEAQLFICHLKKNQLKNALYMPCFSGFIMRFYSWKHQVIQYFWGGAVGYKKRTNRRFLSSASFYIAFSVFEILSRTDFVDQRIILYCRAHSRNFRSYWIHLEVGSSEPHDVWHDCMWLVLGLPRPNSSDVTLRCLDNRFQLKNRFQSVIGTCKETRTFLEKYPHVRHVH